MNVVFATTLVFTALAAVPHDVQANSNRLGIRGGVTDDHDTGFIGMFLVSNLTSSGFRIAPSFDLGFGDREAFDIFTLRGTANFEYAIAVSRSVSLFPIIGASVIYTNFSDCVGDCDEVDAGMNLGMGLQANQFRGELTAGIGDIPDITLALGFTF